MRKKIVEEEEHYCYCRICGNETEADFDLCELCAEAKVMEEEANQKNGTN